MKKIFLTFGVSLLFFTCQTNKVTTLKNKISKLEKLNKKLTDSLNKITINKLSSSLLVGIPDKKHLEVGKTNYIRFYIPSYQKLPKYNIYQIINDSNTIKKRKLIFENHTDSHFIFKFTPKDSLDKSIEILAEFYFNNTKIQLPKTITIE